MGKGGGKGRGKGGEGCDNVAGMCCCLFVILFGGPVLIAAGIGTLASIKRHDRAEGIEATQASADVWTNPGPNNYTEFGKLKLVAYFVAVSQGNQCPNIEATLQADASRTDSYRDEWELFGGLPQQRLQATVSTSVYPIFSPNCQYKVTVRSSPAAAPLIDFTIYQSFLYDVSISDLDDGGGGRNCPAKDECNGIYYQDCKYNCLQFYGSSAYPSTFDCNQGNYKCQLNRPFNNVCGKVSAAPDGTIVTNTTFPAPSMGCNVYPQAFYKPPGEFFSVQNIALSNFIGYNSLTITIRSAYDPWLQFMYATDGTGYFGLSTRQKVISGVSMIVIGSIGTIFWFLCIFYSWRMCWSRHKPTSRPLGWADQRAWDIANRYGGRWAPAPGYPVQSPYANAYGVSNENPYGNFPMAQPAQGYSAQGYPAPGYQYPYPGPQGGVEMSHFDPHAAPAYSPQYPPPAQQYTAYPPPRVPPQSYPASTSSPSYPSAGPSGYGQLPGPDRERGKGQNI